MVVVLDVGTIAGEAFAAAVAIISMIADNISNER
jgi:hypothetical protein